MTDHATLLACYRSGQIPEAAWQEHLKDEGLRAYVDAQRAVVRLDPKALMPCPFCGDKPELHQAEERKSAAVMCGCTAMVMGSFGEDAVATWNRRAPASSAAVPADVAGLVEELQTFKAAFAADGDNFGMEVSEAFHNAATALVSMSAELAAKDAALAEARKALEPFSDALDDLAANGSDKDETCIYGASFITYGHLRAARRAHQGGEDNGA